MASQLNVNANDFVSDRELRVAMDEHDKLITELDKLRAMRDRLGTVTYRRAYTARMLKCERLMEVIERRSAYCAAERVRNKQVLYMRALPAPRLPPHWA